ncbi:hypothetical protein [Prosthecobacter vanneervenii]|uniref:Uncharacterized protein n=1 Tax=Prosthecobacter vanneervenii TaxID=48466 RepID=A0A7W7YE45_9BACT|nr:hypothetical protein [Prosthecobacter vanneervenii]MBB5034511.1 hypothetical protein [Prosthecobacter vanneervenii]
MLRRLFSKRTARVLLWLFISLLTLVVLLHVWTNWSGARRWAAARVLVENEGETFDFHSLLPQTPPEAQNLLAIEPLRGIAAVVEGDASKGEPGTRRKALEALKWTGTAPAAQGVASGQATDFRDWVKFLRDSKYLDLPATPEPTARDVLAALDARHPLLKQISDAVPTRPLAMFTPGLHERPLPELLLSMPLPHYTAVQGQGRALGLRARAALAAGDSAEATRSILAVHLMAQACEQEPLLISFLVGHSLETLALEPLWQGLKDRSFTPEDLQRLQSAFSSPDQTTRAMLQAMRGEMAAGYNALDLLQQTASGRRAMDEMLSGALSASGRSTSRALLRLVPGGLFDHWKSVLVELEMQQLILPLKQDGLHAALTASEKMMEALKQRSNVLRHPDYLVARLLLPSVTQVSCNALLIDARRRQALTALALERFFVKNARYPAALAELAPDYLPAIPTDPCDSQPLRYRTTPAGRYALWSIAFDGKDDSGKVTPDSKTSPKLSKREYKGDWTWTYDPVK